MKLIVGLGNLGKKYEATRHNAGFWFVDEVARSARADFRRESRFQAEVARLPGGEIWLLKPETFMNNSGSALTGYGNENLIVVHDDLDLPPGDVRVKVGGGAGGHNGLRSVIQRLGPDFCRVRVGIGRPPAGMGVTDYVLSRMDAAVRDAVPRAADAVEAVVADGPEAAMNRFNVRT